MNPRPEQWNYLYYFTEYALQLNFLTDDIKPHLPPSDSRLRPDQRMLEEGDTVKASDLKRNLEEAQRTRRKELEASGGTYNANYFEKTKLAGTEEECWRFTGKYWEDRKKKEWAHLTRIF